MVSAINSSVSGLNAAGTRLQVSAQNIANPSKPKQVNQVSLGNGGVQAKVSNASSKSSAAPQEQQLLNLKLASYDFQANLKPIKVQSNMDKSLLNIKS